MLTSGGSEVSITCTNHGAHPHVGKHPDNYRKYQQGIRALTHTYSVQGTHTHILSSRHSHTHTEIRALTHTHTEIRALTHTHTEFRALMPTHTEFRALTHTHTEFRALTHTHTEFRALTHTHTEFRALTHTHTEFRALTHTHTEFRALTHTHTEFRALTHPHTEFRLENPNIRDDDAYCPLQADWLFGLVEWSRAVVRFTFIDLPCIQRSRRGQVAVRGEQVEYYLPLALLPVVKLKKHTWYLNR